MSLEQLNQQQELAIQKLSTLSTIIGPSSPPSYLMLYNALQQALDMINEIVDHRVQEKQPKY
jgi:hypothetical protein